MIRDINEEKDEVICCNECLSIAIKAETFKTKTVDLCLDCLAIDNVRITSFSRWEEAYKHKHGKKYTDESESNNIKGEGRD